MRVRVAFFLSRYLLLGGRVAAASRGDGLTTETQGPDGSEENRRR